MGTDRSGPRSLTSPGLTTENRDPCRHVVKLIRTRLAPGESPDKGASLFVPTAKALATSGRSAYLKGRPDAAPPAMCRGSLVISRPGDRLIPDANMHGSIPAAPYRRTTRVRSPVSFFSRDGTGERNPPPSFHPQMVKTTSERNTQPRTEQRAGEMNQQITLYTSNEKIRRMITKHFRETSFEVTTRSGTPTSADFVVTPGKLQRPVEVFAANLGATAAVIPEALMYLAGQAHLRRGLVLVGSDRKAAAA